MCHIKDMDLSLAETIRAKDTQIPSSAVEVGEGLMWRIAKGT